MPRHVCVPCQMSSHGTVLPVHDSCVCGCHPPQRMDTKGKVVHLRVKPPDASRLPKKSRCQRQIERLLERDGDRCHWCGKQFTDRLRPTREHVIPRSKLGGNGIDNLVLACSPCNNARGDEDYDAYRQRNGRIQYDENQRTAA